jgi:amidophosphoribosyltransferase
MRISCPPLRHPCFYGIDFPTTAELVAGEREVDEVCEFIGADSLGYLSLESLFEPFDNAACGFCSACFTGVYPTDIDGIKGKHALESNYELGLDL